MSAFNTRDKTGFDGEWFLKNFCSLKSGIATQSNLRRFICREIHSAFATGEIKGDNLLDIGTGPTIYTVISAAPHVQNIYLSDHSKDNINILRDWVDAERDDGIDLCQYILQLESNSQTVELRFNEIRKKVRSVLSIDVMESPMINETIAKPDIILSSLCFESACKSLEEYRDVVRRLYQLLLPGGHLVVTGVIGGTFYKVGSIKLPSLQLNEFQLRNAYENNGFVIKKWQSCVPPERSSQDLEYSDFRKMFAMYAKKI